MRPGEVLGGRFELIRELGAGGMGIVYHAFDRERRQAVAIKTLRGFDPDALFRLKHEFRELAELVHPNLVRLHELLGDGHEWWIAMELVDGVPITEFLSARDPAQVRAVLAQLVEAVAAVHAGGKLHRDIKPANVLVDREGRVVLLDFGLVTAVAAGERRREVVDGLSGTPAYMAPELFEAGAVTAAADWYAVGAVLFEVLVGEPAFDGRFAEIVLAKLRPEPPRASERLAADAGELGELSTRLMARDPASRPDAAELRRAIAGSPRRVTGAQLPWARDAFVGRESELTALVGAWRAVRTARRARGVVIRGSSGIGKTTLVGELRARLVEEDPAVLVFAGRCHERETVPFKAIDPIIDELAWYLRCQPASALAELVPDGLGALALAFPVLRRIEVPGFDPARPAQLAADPHELRRSVGAALRDLLVRVARRERVLVWMDDLQWSDVDSAALFSDLVAGRDAPPILWIAAHRSAPGSAAPGLAAFERAFASLGEACDEIDLGGLSPTDAAQLALHRTGAALAGSDAARVAELGGGNPFFVLALVDHLAEGGDSASIGPRAPIPSLDELLGKRLARLPNAARRLLEVIALADGPIGEKDACDIAAIGPPLASIDVLERGRWVGRWGEARGPLDTRHDRMREATIATIPPDRRVAVHARLADRWAAVGDVEPARIASQLLGANRLAEAGTYLEVAARRASASLAFDAAASLLKQALALAPGERRASLELALATALADAGRGAEAAPLFESASARSSAVEAPSLRWRAAEEWLRAGFVDRGLEIAAEALGGLGMPMPDTPGAALRGIVVERARLWLARRVAGLRRARAAGRDELARIDTSFSFAAAMGLVDPIVGALYQARHLRLAARLRGEPERTSRALALEAAYRAALGVARPERIAGSFVEARSLAVESGEARAVAFVTLLEGIAWHQRGEWGRSRALAVDAERTFRERCAGVAWERVNARRLLLTNLYWLGDFPELARLVPGIVEDARRRGDRYEELVVTGFFSVVTRLAAADLDGAERDVDRAASIASSRTPRLFDVYRLLGACQLDLQRGRPDLAWERLAAAWNGLERAQALRMTAARILLGDLRARVALLLGTSGRAAGARLRVAERDARKLRRLAIPWPGALAAVVEAGLAQARGDPGAAVVALERALVAFEDRGMIVHAATVRHRLAALGAGGEGDGGREEALGRLSAHGIADPARWSSLLAPVPVAAAGRSG